MNFMKNINICIVHYNTPYMTECLIKSINKYVGHDCHIYIFDNSDKEPFVYKQDNITLFDNTKGQIINFNEWLKNFPKKGGEATGKFASAKHTISIDKCMDLINDNFILMDSDILLKKDVSDLYDDNYIFIGEYEMNPTLKKRNVGRILPFICFINVKMCQEYNVRYFNENFMHGLNKFTIGHYYDTGGGFYINARNYAHKCINIGEYITHYKGGSWDYTYPSCKKIHGNLTPVEWLNYNKEYWNNNKQVIYTCLTGNYENLVDPSVVSEDFNYVCFTDNMNLSSNVWILKPIPNELLHLSKVKQQRCIKICPHKYLSEYETSIWVDACIDIVGDMKAFLNSCCCDENKSIFIPKHPNRNCIYEEMKACFQIKKDTMDNMGPQINKYKEEKYPSNNGLVQSNIVIRKHNNKQCIEVMEIWKKELITHSHRDQLSFNYALWKTNNYETFKYLDKTLCNSKYFKWYLHHNRGKIINQAMSPNNLKNLNNKTINSNKLKKIHSPFDVVNNSSTTTQQQVKTKENNNQIIETTQLEVITPKVVVEEPKVDDIVVSKNSFYEENNESGIIITRRNKPAKLHLMIKNENVSITVKPFKGGKNKRVNNKLVVNFFQQI